MVQSSIFVYFIGKCGTFTTVYQPGLGGVFFADLGRLSIYQNGGLATFDHVLVDHNLVHAVIGWQVEHRIQLNRLKNGPQPTRASFALDCLLGNGFQRIISEA